MFQINKNRFNENNHFSDSKKKLIILYIFIEDRNWIVLPSCKLKNTTVFKRKSLQTKQKIIQITHEILNWVKATYSFLHKYKLLFVKVYFIFLNLGKFKQASKINLFLV